MGAKQEAPRIFASCDSNKDGSLTSEEIEKRVRGDAAGALGWHDLDEDGIVTLAEFTEGFAFWAATTHDVLKDTPEQWKKYQLTDMQGDFNIEDLSRKVT